jgi:hypothetical protein
MAKSILSFSFICDGCSILTFSFLRTKVETYFCEVNGGSTAKYVPRSVQIDLEAGVCDRVRNISNRVSHQTSSSLYFLRLRHSSGESWHILRYVPAPMAHCSSRTRLSLEMAERGTTGQKAVRHLFLFLFYFLLTLIRRSRHGSVYTDGMLNAPHLSRRL